MKYIVIGLGNYGSALAVELATLGHEVIGTDVLGNRVEAIKEKIATAFVLNAADDSALSVLPLNEVDAVIVTIGENFGASIRVTAMLKLHKVQHIYARAIDDVHKAVLEAFELDKILTPEEDAAYSFVEQLSYGTKIETFPVDKEYMISRFAVPDKFVGKHVSELNLEQDFKLKIVALTRMKKITNLLGFTIKEQMVVDDLYDNAKIVAGDELICYGMKADFQEFWKKM